MTQLVIILNGFQNPVNRLRKVKISKNVKEDVVEAKEHKNVQKNG